LPTLGISVVLDTVQQHGQIEGHGPALASVSHKKYQEQSLSSALQLRRWCRGILNVLTVDPGQVSEIFGDAADTDRASGERAALRCHLDVGIRASTYPRGKGIPLCQIHTPLYPGYLGSRRSSQGKAEDKFTDEDVMEEGIVATLIAETNTTYHDHYKLLANLAFYMQHVLRLMRLRPIQTT